MSQDDPEVGMPLRPIPGSAEDHKEDDQNIKHPRKQRKNKDQIKNYRKLAIGSVICGCSCVGYKALENSFKVDHEEDIEQKRKYSKEARKYGIISIVTLIGILILVPVLLVFVSYLLTLKD